jgi:hypothetical protein
MVSRGGFVAYYRISTGKQGKSGLGLEARKSISPDSQPLDRGLGLGRLC